MNEALRKAVRWLSDEQDYSVEAINRAVQRFDLSPLDADFLIRTFLHADRKEQPEQS